MYVFKFTLRDENILKTRDECYIVNSSVRHGSHVLIETQQIRVLQPITQKEEQIPIRDEGGG